MLDNRALVGLFGENFHLKKKKKSTRNVNIISYTWYLDKVFSPRSGYSTSEIEYQIHTIEIVRKLSVF